MAKNILMPQVGQDLTEGKVVAMNVAIGDKVAKGDIVAEVESEKATFEVESFEEGVVTEIRFGQDEMAVVLEPLVILDGETSSASAPATGAPATEATATEAPASSGKAPANSAPAPAAVVHDGKRRSTPLARRVMAQNGIDIANVTGSGPDGAVVLKDVEAAIAAGNSAPVSAPAAAPVSSSVSSSVSSVAPAIARAPEIQVMSQEGDSVIEFTRMRQIIADRLVLSKQTIPHFYLQTDVDVTRLLARRAERNAMGDVKISVNDVIIQSVARCLMEYRNLNSHVSQNALTIKGDINIGMAVSVEDGLMVPVIANANTLNLDTIAEQSRDAANNARRGIFKSNVPGTFTISNLGMYGVEVFPIINPPEAGILGVGGIRDEVKAVGNGMAIRKIMRLVISADHRAVDGVYAAKFLAQLKQDLEEHNLND